MSISFDHSVIQKMKEDVHFVHFLKDLKSDHAVYLDWASLLQLLGLENLFEFFPKFGEENPVFKALISILITAVDQETLYELYDQIFVECLTQIKALSQIQQPFLIEKIQAFRTDPAIASLFTEAFDQLEISLKTDPYATMHDLILYLAWDRMCIQLAILFEFRTENANFIHGISVLKECLIESFLHILNQGKTIPSYFRLLEAIYAYQMREEIIHNHTETDWSILCHSSKILKPSDQLPGIQYVDGLFRKNEGLLKLYTLDSEEKIRASLSLAGYVSQLIKQEANKAIQFKKMDIFRVVDGKAVLFNN